ncbi:hypothetical protein KJ965_04755, partial [Patescibacteria group bacterium]|nr:hypothetical protein [Patescibacteria group bacterium]
SMNSDESSPDRRQLTADGSNSNPQISGDGSKIAFVKAGDIYTINSDGTGLTSLTSDGLNSDPQISGDGSRVVWEKSGEIYTANAGGLTHVTATILGGNSTPQVSIDGNRLVWEKSGDLYTIDFGGTGVPVQMTSDGGNSGPKLSGSGNRIAWGKGSNAAIANFDGSDLRTPGAGNVVNISDDGNITVWERASDIYSYNFSTNTLLTINPGGADMTPDVSGDGSTIVWRRPGWNIGVSNSDGTDFLVLTDNNGNRDPQLSYDGSKTVWTNSGGGIYISENVNLNEFTLANTPNSVTSVTVNSGAIGENATNGWTLSDNVVTLHGSSIPTGGQTVDITYLYGSDDDGGGDDGGGDGGAGGGNGGSISFDRGYNEFTFHVGPNSEDAIGVRIPDMRALSLGLSGFRADSVDSLLTVDSALHSVTYTRAGIGAFGKRMESALMEGQLRKESLAGAELSIRGLDYAEESKNFVLNQILYQSGQAVLVQANLLPQTIMGLL